MILERRSSTIISSSSIYHELYNTILDLIRNGDLKYGQRLQTEHWMCEKYHVSRTTLRKVINNLIEDGYLERKINKGVYVVYQSLNTNFDHPSSLFQEMTRLGANPSSKILLYNLITAGKQFSDIFHIPASDNIMKIIRLRFLDNTPVVLQTMYLPEKYFDDFNPWELRTASFHALLEEKYQMKIAQTVQNINVMTANEYISGLLEIPLHTPLLNTNSTMMLKNNMIVEYQESCINTNILPYSYVIQMD